MIPREKIIIDASGKPGEHAVQHHGQRDVVAQAGRNGANGRSSCAATEGTDGRDICVNLSRTEDEEALVIGEAQWEGTRWTVSRDHILLLDSKGGDGGNGGKGEDGQQGGQGSRGRDATKYRNAENGGRGARGGDGGKGTNGANGGKAGNVLISVRQDDTDLLLPVYWDIRGGSGGTSGSHGDPGDGGIGGDGGYGCTWTERNGNTVTERSRPPGMPGHTGEPGARPPEYLSGGSSGAQGSSQVRVLMNNNTESTYPSIYQLKVVSFDVIDENEDGVNEPGEHLLIKNIRVENTGKLRITVSKYGVLIASTCRPGGMPSPSAAEIQVLVHGTHWLEPIISEPVYLPKSIPVGATVDVPGILRAFIMQERSPRAPGQLLLSSDEIQLIATAVRMNRTLPEFSGSTKILIQYPLQLDPPRYLDCVAQGDQVTFSWTLRNVSTKPYGLHGFLGRHAGTCLSDPEGVFDFVEPGVNEHKMADFLETLDPGSEVPISQTFQVSSLAMPYSAGHLKLDLLLSEPGHIEERFSSLSPDHEEYAELRTVATYDILLQISGVYSYNPESSYLLVINAQTPNNIIHCTIKFVRETLKVPLDVFNISVTGTFIDKKSSRNILLDYFGKSVIVFADQFNYFGRGKRTAISFIDPCLACLLLKAGTGMLLAGTEESGVSAAQGWITSVKFPLNPYHCLDETPAENSSAQFQSLKTLESAMFEAENQKMSALLPKYTYAAAKPTLACLATDNSTLLSAGKTTATRMTKAFPLRRFTVTTDTSTRNKNSPGSVHLREGLPLYAKLITTKVPFKADGDNLAENNKFLLFSILAFEKRASIFWNMADMNTETGIKTKEADTTKQNISISVTEDTSMSKLSPILPNCLFPVPEVPQIYSAIASSVEYDLTRELNQYISSSTWPDPIPTAKHATQLPLLSQFFATASTTTPIPQIDASNPAFLPLTSTLAALTVSALPITLGQKLSQSLTFGLIHRRARISTHLQTLIATTLVNRFGPEPAAQLQKSIAATSVQLRKDLASRPESSRSTALLALERVARETGVERIGAGFVADLADMQPGSVDWSAGLPKDVPDHEGVAAFVRADEEWSRGVLAEMVSEE